MSTNKEPRSIRLTQAHRSDIVSAVMKQWEVTNPAPNNGTFAEFIMALLPRLMKMRKNAPAEMKAFRHLIERTKTINTVLEHLTPESRKLVRPVTNSSFNLQVVLENGDTGATFGFEIPAEVADKLGIPYVDTTLDSYEVDAWKDVVSTEIGTYKQCPCVRIANFAADCRTTLVIPRDDKDYQAYTKAKREQRKWEEERSKVREEITDYLNQFNTTKQIRDAWPELVDYLPAHLADPERVIQLPAIARSRLNERLGLAG